MRIILAFDNDIGGIKAIENALRAFDKYKEFIKTESKIFNLKLKLGLPISKEHTYKEEFEINKSAKEIIKEHRPAPKSEREKIFLEDGSVKLGEAHEAKRLYLQNILKEISAYYFQIEAHNEKYPEFALWDLFAEVKSKLKKAQKDYDWHIKLTPREEINIDQIKQNRKIGEFIKINQAGFVKCPFHNEQMPSLKVNKEETLFYCFGCGVGGSVIDFVMKLNNWSFLETIKYLNV